MDGESEYGRLREEHEKEMEELFRKCKVMGGKSTLKVSLTNIVTGIGASLVQDTFWKYKLLAISLASLGILLVRVYKHSTTQVIDEVEVAIEEILGV